MVYRNILVSTHVEFYLELLADSSELFTIGDLFALLHPHGSYEKHAEFVVANFNASSVVVNQ